MSKPTLTEAGFQAAADSLNCEIAAIKAVCQVEAPKGGFLPDDRVTILFERHKFYKYTGGKKSPFLAHADLCNPDAGGYGAAGAHQWSRFNRASGLDANAAKMATSWGKFQIMGFNYDAAGFETVDEFVDAMGVSEDDQLKAFVNFVKSEGLADELRNHNWAGFARGYNGANYKINNYDTKLAAAYRKFKGIKPSETSRSEPAKPSDVLEPGMQPVVDQPKEPPPKEINSETATSVPISRPSLWGQIKDVTIPTGIGGALTAIGTIFKTIPPWAWAVIIIAVIAAAVYLISQRSRRAHERTLKAGDMAGNPERNNIWFK